MPQIILKQPGQPVADFSVNGAVVTVAGVAIDCAAREQDTAQTLEIRAQGGEAHEGGDGAYLAQIEIPARRYEEAAGEIDPETGEAESINVAVALDPARIVITLWPAA